MEFIEFGYLLKSWREKRGMSQLSLSLEANVSQKHISFIESGRSSPSSKMVRLLCNVMDLPLIESNKLLLRAGFAPEYSEHALDEPFNQELKAAVELIINNHMPLPALVFDHLHNVLMANGAAMEFQMWLYDGKLPDFASNLLVGLFHSEGYGRYLKNFEEVASFMFRRLTAEVSQMGRPSEEANRLISTIRSMESFDPSYQRNALRSANFPALTMDFEKDGISESVYSLVSSFGAPFDITIQNLRIELFFPRNK